MKKRKSYVIPIRPHLQLESQHIVTQVTPMAAVEERARVQHINDVEKGMPHANLKSGIKSQHKPIYVTPFMELNRLTSSKKKKRKPPVSGGKKTYQHLSRRKNYLTENNPE